MINNLKDENNSPALLGRVNQQTGIRMQFPDDLINQLTPSTLRVVAVTALGALGTIGLILLRQVLKTIKHEWTQAKVGIHTMNSRLTTITENHLTHVQENTAKTVELLERMANEQAELNGYLKGKLDRN
jgi:hypothetical protein